MTFEEKMERNDPIDQIEIGGIVETALNGNIGTILRLVIEGLKSDYLSTSERMMAIPADRTLGRLEGLSKLQDQLDYCVLISRQLQEEKKEDNKVKKG